MTPPTQLELIEENGLVEIESHCSEWRHGTNRTIIYHRQSDDTCWRLTYQHQLNGDYNGLRDGDYRVVQVYPVKYESIRYEEIPC